MQATTDEARLVDLARSGSLPAFNQLVVLHQQTAYNVACRLLGNAEAAADVTQDAFVSAFEHLSGFRGGSFRSWLLRIATNGCYDYLRASQRRPATSLEAISAADEGGFDPPDPADSPERIALRRETVAAIQKGLLTLPLDMRTAVVLYDVQGLSYDEIAEVTAVSLGTVKSRISRGRAKMRDYLTAHRELLA